MWQAHIVHCQNSSCQWAEGLSVPLFLLACCCWGSPNLGLVWAQVFVSGADSAVQTCLFIPVSMEKEINDQHHIKLGPYHTPSGNWGWTSEREHGGQVGPCDKWRRGDYWTGLLQCRRFGKVVTVGGACAPRRARGGTWAGGRGSWSGWGRRACGGSGPGRWSCGAPAPGATTGKGWAGRRAGCARGTAGERSPRRPAPPTPWLGWSLPMKTKLFLNSRSLKQYSESDQMQYYI